MDLTVTTKFQRNQSSETQESQRQHSRWVTCFFAVGLGLSGCGGGENAVVAETPAAPTAVQTPVAQATVTAPVSPTIAPPVTAVVTNSPTPDATPVVPAPPELNVNLKVAGTFPVSGAQCGISSGIPVVAQGRIAEAVWEGCATSKAPMSIAVSQITQTIVVHYGDPAIGIVRFQSRNDPNAQIDYDPVTRVVRVRHLALSLDANPVLAGIGGALPQTGNTIAIDASLRLP